MPVISNRCACFFLILLALPSCCQASTTSETSSVSLRTAPVVTVSSLPSFEIDHGGGNGAAFDLGNFLKGELKFCVEAPMKMWRAHGRCNDIRAKQRSFRESLRSEWLEHGADSKDVDQRLKTVHGGISYEEFEFLQRGKEDRQKLLSLMVCSVFSPKVLVPISWIAPVNAWPSHFQRPKLGMGETPLETLSRVRSHAVLQMILHIEKECTTRFQNPFKSRTIRPQTLAMRNIVTKAVNLFMSGNLNPDSVLKCIDNKVYLKEEPKRGKGMITSIADPVVKWFGPMINGETRFYDAMVPTILTRGFLASYLTRVKEADEFLVEQGVDIETLSTKTIVDACNARMIGTLGRTDMELKQQLREWLEHTTIGPTKRVQTTGECFNGHLARSALMTYFALDAVRDERSASRLPRLLFTNVSPPVMEDPEEGVE